ncbi:alpha/beta hydrolase [Myxosarcina sp. GI1]|uniref:alpha/beta hydrolase n=1 Tax=Myxosarcina sp. GI1 TaxID=1541065 RepID=UPI00056D3754|nr:alpha/beta hydrolase [Myxosarcina sp. GI1]
MKIFKLVLAIALASYGIAIFKPQSVSAANKITFSLSILGEFQVSIDDLAVFARKGTITPEFAYYTDRLDRKTVRRLRQILQTNFAVDPVTVYRLTNMPMGEDFLRRLGSIIYTHPQENGIFAIRSALILAASEPEGLTTINFLRHFPTEEMQLNTEIIFSLIKETENFFQYKDAILKAIAKQAKTEITSQKKLNFNNLPDLLQPGKYQVRQREINFSVDDLRQTATGFAGAYDLNADIYLPIGLKQAAPLAIIAHGLGSERSDFAYLAKHLASYGYIVVIPEHSGSSGKYKEAYLQGEVGVDISPIEFYSRPRDITHLLNKLEQSADFQRRIDWQQIGIIGHSFGGTTALLTAGAPLNLARLHKICQQERFTLNISLFLQCRASNLPPGNYNLQDSRIKAAIALNPVTSSVLGPESIQRINIPTLFIGGTKDFVSPFVEEQAHPFLWLTTADKYLATIVNGSHFSTINEENIAGINDFLKGFRPDLGRKYLKALSLAFFEAHVRQVFQARSYLTAAYAKKISNRELPLYLIQSLTPEQIASAYGKTPPTSPIPQPLATVEPLQNRDVLAEIARTGMLKVAMRTDAAPFGYIERDRWAGYCADLATAFGDRLSQELNTAKPIKVIKVPSSLANRFELVKQETVHLECGPNSIVNNKEVVFSDPFFSSGTRFLVNGNNATKLDLENPLEGIKLGVLQGTTTQKFVERNYPDAEIFTYESNDGRSKGIQAVKNGDIDAFVSDIVLLTGEIDRQGLKRNNYQTIPEYPLTCEYYGLILPAGDERWRYWVNTFIRDRATKEQVFDRWLGDYYNRAIADLDYCQNRR